MIETLQSSFRIPEYPLIMDRDYLKERGLQYKTSSELCAKKVTAGAAQGSVFGHDFWNVSTMAFYDCNHSVCSWLDMPTM